MCSSGIGCVRLGCVRGVAGSLEGRVVEGRASGPIDPGPIPASARERTRIGSSPGAPGRLEPIVRRAPPAAALSILLVLGALGPARAQMECPRGILSCWPLDETDGAPFCDVLGLHDASCPEVCPSPVAGQVGSAQRMEDGTRLLTTGLSIPGWTRSDSFSFEAWMRTSSATAGAYIAIRDPGSGAFIRLGQSRTGAPWFGLKDTSGRGLFTLRHRRNPVLDAWHHVVGVRDATAGEVRLYVDSTLVKTEPDTFTGDFLFTGVPVTMGWEQDRPEFDFGGDLDALAISTRQPSSAAP